MRALHIAALAVVAAPLTAALTVAGAYPAGAATLINYRDYQQTLPYSVIQGLDLDQDEETKLTNNTRTGVVGDKTVVPLKSIPGPRFGLIGAALSTVLYIDGQIESTIEFDRDGVRPEWIDAEEWDACAPSGGDDWLGNFFDGARDWTASFGGIDCNEVRQGWEVLKDANYQPIGGPAPLAGYPQTSTNSTFGFSTTVLQPFWSSTPTTAIASDPPGSVEGWVYPVQMAGTYAGTVVQVNIRWISSTGAAVVNQVHSLNSENPGVQQQPTVAHPQCATVSYCLVAAGVGNSTRPATPPGVMALMTSVASFGTNTKPLTPMPYVNPTDGSAPAPDELARQVLLTTVWTAEGNTYQCRTVSFVETAPTIPRPCEPEVPPGEHVIERTVEVVPETDPGYVPGSDPTRGVTRTTVPDVVRDWSQDAPAERRYDLRKLGLGSCFDFPDACLDWFEDQDKLNKYECHDGTAVVALSECTKYARLFKPGALTSGTPYPQPGTDPGATPGGQTGTAPNTGTAPGSSPADPTKTRECWPTGWGILNPFEWVYKPVRCVIEWAFVPRPEVIKANNNRMLNSWQTTTALRQVMAGMQTLLMAIPTDGGCGGIPLHYEFRGSVVDETLLYSCSGPLAPAAATTKSILTGSIIFAGFLACVRYIAVIFGFVGYGQVLDMRAAEKAERRSS